MKRFNHLLFGAFWVAIVLGGKFAGAGELSPPPASPCVNCKSAQLIAMLRVLNYSNSDDRRKGRRLAKDVYSRLLSRTQEAGGALNVKTFTAFLSLAREAEPYDGEGRIAQLLAGQISAAPFLKAAFASYLSHEPLSGNATECKNRRLETAVQEAICLREQLASHNTDDIDDRNEMGPSCYLHFNYSTCIGAQAQAPAAVGVKPE